MEEEVIELARDPEGPELRAGRVNRLEGGVSPPAFGA